MTDPRGEGGSLLVADVTVGDRAGRAMLVTDGRIAWLGAATDAPAAARVVAGDGAHCSPPRSSTPMCTRPQPDWP